MPDVGHFQETGGVGCTSGCAPRLTQAQSLAGKPLHQLLILHRQLCQLLAHPPWMSRYLETQRSRHTDSPGQLWVSLCMGGTHLRWQALVILERRVRPDQQPAVAKPELATLLPCYLISPARKAVQTPSLRLPSREALVWPTVTPCF